MKFDELTFHCIDDLNNGSLRLEVLASKHCPGTRGELLQAGKLLLLKKGQETQWSGQ